MIIGYLLGTLSPAALLGRKKNVDLRKEGTHNLGASNTTLVLGKGYGALVMMIDILKAFVAAKTAKWLFPKLAAASILAGFAAVVGHIFPFYMNFKGGKGLAAFGGMILAYNPWVFLFLLSTGVFLMLVFNASVALPIYVAVVFPVFVWFGTHHVGMLLITVATSILIVVKHWSNIDRIKRGEEVNLRKFFKNIFKKEKANP